jgi:ABC-type antimicrobial peptide transport system permease subunit
MHETCPRQLENEQAAVGPYLLGIVIGIASVIAMMSIGEGGRKLVSMELAGLGSDLIFVQPDYTAEAISGARRKSLTYEDAEAIRKWCPAVAGVSVQRVGMVTVKYGTDRYNTSATFTDEGLSTMYQGRLKEGRFLQELDVRIQRPVVILGGSLANKFFGESGAIGEKVKVNGQSFSVIGVMKEEGRTIFGENPSDMSVYLPITHSKRFVTIRANLNRGCVDQGTDDRDPAGRIKRPQRRNSAQPSQSRPADKPEKNSLGLISSVMP